MTAEEWPHPVEQPLGPEIRDFFARQDFLRAHDDAALLGARFRLAQDVVQEQVGLPGAEDPEHVVLRGNRGMRRATKVDTVGAGFAGLAASEKEQEKAVEDHVDGWRQQLDILKARAEHVAV